LLEALVEGPATVRGASNAGCVISVAKNTLAVSDDRLPLKASARSAIESERAGDGCELPRGQVAAFQLIDESVRPSAPVGLKPDDRRRSHLDGELGDALACNGAISSR
jgi:hypothetical protein